MAVIANQYPNVCVNLVWCHQISPYMTEQMLKGLDAALAEAGRSRADIEIVMMPGDDSEDAVRAFADLGVNRLTPMIGLDSPGKTTERIRYLERLAGLF